MEGLVMTGGPRAWAFVSGPANGTGPAVQRILDLGGVLVGKYKLAQHYPFNPRGDDWLTCSASSSGGGCAIAAHDFLDYAIGTDTGISMQVPAAVSGTYGQRPSQGIISLEQVMPGGAATDTAGDFSRDPHKWVYFSKHWYTPALHQSSDITGLSTLEIPDTNAFPKTILYPIDFLPLNNSVKRFNFSATVGNASNSAVADLTEVNNSGPLGIIDLHTQYESMGRPLTSQWAEMFDGRFPPIDPARRDIWHNYNETKYSQEAYNNALRQKKEYVEWYESHLQYSTPESCSESVMLYDSGTGGLPSYWEKSLNMGPNATFIDLKPEGAAIDAPSICPLYGCADFTISIGQVPYWSKVTYHYEMVPVTINMVVKRECDFVLYKMIEKLADAGVLKTVKTGKNCFLTPGINSITSDAIQ